MEIGLKWQIVGIANFYYAAESWKFQIDDAGRLLQYNIMININIIDLRNFDWCVRCDTVCVAFSEW